MDSPDIEGQILELRTVLDEERDRAVVFADRPARARSGRTTQMSGKANLSCLPS